MKIFVEDKSGTVKEADTNDYALPCYVIDTLKAGCMSIHNDLLLSPTLEMLKESEQHP